MKRVVLVSLVVISLAACRREPEQEVVEPVNVADETANAVVADLPEPDINASLEKIGALHPDEADYRFAGRWAVDERLCENAAWRFTNTELHTPGGSVCRFTDVREVSGGYDVAARCAADRDERDDRLRIRFPQSAGGMLLDAESIADAGLTRCEE